MKKLLIYLKEYKKESILAPLFKMLEACFELLVPLVVAGIIDRGIGISDTSYIIRMGLYLLGLGAIGLTCSITAQFFAAKAAVGFSVKLRQALFDHLQGLNFTNIDKLGTSTMITRMTSDVNQVQSGVNMVLRLFLRSPVIVFGAMIMAFFIDVRSAIVFLVIIPLLGLVVFGLMWFTIPRYRKVQKLLDRVVGITRENLTGVRVIRAFHQEAEEEGRFKEENRTLANLQLFVGKISACMNPLTFVIVNAGVIVLIYIGAIQVDIGNLTQGEVVAIIGYMSQILVELLKLANLIILVTKALACAGRVSAVFEINNEEDMSLLDGASTTVEALTTHTSSNEKPPYLSNGKMPYLSIEHVSFTYQGAGAEALHDIHFSVNEGETVGIIGGTGSGKTTLINLIPGLYPVTKGSIRLEGKNIHELPEEYLRRRVGIVPQRAVLFKGTIKSNLEWGKPDATEEEMWEALTVAQAREVVEEKYNNRKHVKSQANISTDEKHHNEEPFLGKLDVEVSQNGKNFSGGQRQRLTIARALVRKPDILILDDSASALDYMTEAKLRNALKNNTNSNAVFIVSQRASSVRHADKIIVLEDGKMAGIGTHEELLQNCMVYQEIYYSQYPEDKKPEDNKNPEDNKKPENNKYSESNKHSEDNL